MYSTAGEKYIKKDANYNARKQKLFSFAKVGKMMINKLYYSNRVYMDECFQTLSNCSQSKEVIKVLTSICHILVAITEEQNDAFTQHAFV